MGTQSPSPGHHSFNVLPLDQWTRTYFWMIQSTSKLQVTSRKIRARFPSTEHKRIARKPTPDQVSLLIWFLAQKWASELVVFLSYMVRLMLKKVFAADSTLSSSFLESLLKMNLQLQDYTCTGDACGSQWGMCLIKYKQIFKDCFIQEAKAK